MDTTYTLSYAVNGFPSDFLDFRPEVQICSDNSRAPFHTRNVLGPLWFWTGVLTGVAGAVSLCLALWAYFLGGNMQQMAG